MRFSRQCLRFSCGEWEDHPDQPERLSHVNANNYNEKVLMYQTIIHITFLLSAMASAYTDKLMSSS
jgi:uncharacterized membrane protein YqhA